MSNVHMEPGSGIASSEVALDWWAIVGTIFSVLGSVATLCWLFSFGRGWSSIPAYFDPSHPSVIAIALLGIGGAFALIAQVQGDSAGRTWVVASSLLVTISVALAILFVVVVPIVIWIVKVLIWMFTVLAVAAGLWAWSSLSRGRAPRWPRSSQGVEYWIRKAAGFVPFGG